MARPLDLLVIGGSGFVGANLAKAALARGYRTAYTFASHEAHVSAESYYVRIEEHGSLENCILQTQPRVIMYCAVPHVSASEQLHYAVNVDAIHRVAACLRKLSLQTLLTYVSTNAIFSGRRGPYCEIDLPDPQSRVDIYRTYAITRAKGENIAQAEWPNTIVARTATVNGHDYQGKLNPRLAYLVETLKAGHAAPLFCDRWLSPTLVDNLVEALLEIIEPSFTFRGILHLSGSQQLTDCEYAVCVARQLGIDENLVERDFRANSPTMANSPHNNSLSVTFSQSKLHTHLLPIPEQLQSLFPTL